MVGGGGEAGLLGELVIERGFHRVREATPQRCANGFDSEWGAFDDLVRDGAPSDSPLLRGLTLDEAADYLQQMTADHSQGGTG